MERKPDSEDARRPACPGRPALRLRLLVAAASPLLCLLLLETTLRLVAYGQPSGFFLRWKAAGRTLYLTNEHYCEHFVAKELSRAPEAGVLAAKDKSTVRVFVLGGSAAYGDPDVAFGFCRHLEVLLNAHSTERSFEVVNAAVTAMNSHVARRIAADCASYEPDVFLVYMGNNEVVGPYGPPTLPEKLYRSRAFINLCITAKKDTRLGQLMDRAGQALRDARGPERKWLGMEAFLDHRIAYDDPKLQSCYRHFRANLRDIAQTAHSCGAKTILCTVPTNIRSCAPFGSGHRAGLSAEQLARWDRHFQQGRQCEASSDFEGALAAYEQARVIDDRHADLAFCQATCLLALGRTDEAKSLFVRARDLDTLRFRADSGIEEAIRESAAALADQGVSLCDLTARFEEHSPHGLLGDDLMLDHVHPTFRGNFLAAMATMRAIREALPDAKLREPDRTEEELLKLCRDRLVFDHRQMYDLAMVMYRRKTLPPFAGQITHERELERLREGLFALRRMVKASQATDEPYLWAIEQAPQDVYVNVRYSQFLVEQGRIAEAVRRCRRLLEGQPYSMTIRLALAGAYALGGMEDQAIEVLTSNQTPYRYDRRRALSMLGTQYAQKGLIAQAATVYEELSRLDPDNVDVLVNLAAAASHRKDYAAMKRYLDKALRIDPSSVQGRINMGNYYAKQNDPNESQKWFAQAVEADPQNYLTHIGLGIQSIRLGQLDKGIEHVTKAVVLKPDFVEGYQILAAAYVEKGDAEQAKKYAALRDLFAPESGRSAGGVQ
ncbi:MAG TPA: tetratricopeptide repeat protein [Sedimentisphaerales bacterium]|nr:tetratricopeptide repeat protein [Sedimentisphaerales bacterium]HRS10980.1 tetratricopeptide repeat protein [Sedimentisphaerales bacterium]HRV48674.1 tetratricopeptide repeat protein [Sedimentisphaerales bacterium]